MRLEIESSEGGNVSYEVSGETAKLLHLRALNAGGKPLASRSSSQSSFGNVESVSRSFAGQVDELEAVFALEEDELRFPFELEGAQPGSDGEFLAKDTHQKDDGPATVVAGKLEDVLDRVASRLARNVESLIHGNDQPIARQRTGPFLVTLESVWSFGSLMPHLQVSSPTIPGVADNPTAVELTLDELRMADGTVHRGAWSEVLAMSEGFGRPGMAGSTQIQTDAKGDGDSLQSVRGRVEVRLPEKVGTERFASRELGTGVETSDLSVKLVELARDRFTLRASQGGERVIGVKAFNAFGDELWVPHSSLGQGEDGSLELQFQVKGVPAEIELRYAEKLASAEYPFVLVRGGREVASTR